VSEGAAVNHNLRNATIGNRLDVLENRVLAQLTGRIQRLQIFQQEKGIVLHGYARTYHAKQLAQHAVMRETDVPIAANEIEVA
jgi:hypothetical protein